MRTNATLLCRKCDRTTSVNQAVLRQRRKAGLQYACKHCGANLLKHGEKPKRGATDSQKRSRDQEKHVASREGGRKQPGSGSVDGFEGDVRVAKKYRGECKLTRAKSFSLKLEELLKLERQAGAGELPAFDIEFQGVNPHRRYVVVPEWVFDSLMEESGRRGDADPNDS
jgi:hypothetical protein